MRACVRSFVRSRFPPVVRDATKIEDGLQAPFAWVFAFLVLLSVVVERTKEALQGTRSARSGTMRRSARERYTNERGENVTIDTGEAMALRLMLHRGAVERRANYEDSPSRVVYLPKAELKKANMPLTTSLRRATMPLPNSPPGPASVSRTKRV